MEIDKPEIVAEMQAVFDRYEKALIANDVAALDEMFLPAATTVRYGIGENLYGIEAIRAYRQSLPPAPLPERELRQTVITTYGEDFATASTLFYRDGDPGKVGRQTQSWVRMPAGWRVVAAHVSMIDEPA